MAHDAGKRRSVSAADAALGKAIEALAQAVVADRAAQRRADDPMWQWGRPAVGKADTAEPLPVQIAGHNLTPAETGFLDRIPDEVRAQLDPGELSDRLRRCVQLTEASAGLPSDLQQGYQKLIADELTRPAGADASAEAGQLREQAKLFSADPAMARELIMKASRVEHGRST